MKNNDPEYVLSISNGEYNFENPSSDFDLIFLLLRKEYEDRQRRIAKEKKEGTYYGVTSNENYPKLPSLDFKIKSKSNIVLGPFCLNDLTFVNFDWLVTNSCIEPNQDNVTFKNIYFLHKINNDSFIIYDVERIVIAQ